jgi:hypothetical protein
VLSEYVRNANEDGLSANAYSGHMISSGAMPVAFAISECFDCGSVTIGLKFHHLDDSSLAAMRRAERFNKLGRSLNIEHMSVYNQGNTEGFEPKAASWC